MRKLQTFVGAAVLTLMAFGSTAAETELLTGEALVEALRAGGLNVYFRHARTNWSQSDQIGQPEDWNSCDPSRVRQLSEEGRQQARQIGEAIRALDIPVGEIVASPYCRTVETAREMGLGAVEPSTDIINLRVARFFGGQAAVVATARARLAEPPPGGTNRILVAHGNVARESTPVYPSEAEGVMFQPDGTGGFRVVGRLRPEDWAELVHTYGQSKP